MRLRLFAFIALMMTAYNGRCGEYLRSPAANLSLSFASGVSDTLAAIAPKGYVLLSYDGAKRALKAKADADAFFKILAVKDSIIFYREFQVRIADDRIAAFEAVNGNHVADIKLLKRKLFWKNTLLTGAGILVVLQLTTGK